MPELPEVITVINYLKQNLIDKKIIDIIIFSEKIKNDFNYSMYNKNKNQKIKNIYNIGKNIIFELNDFKIVSHLRMTGKWSYEKMNENLHNKSWLKLYLQLENDMRASFYDSRGFGTFKIYKNDEMFLNDSKLFKVGIQANDENLLIENLFNITSKSSKKIKTLLLDQTIISGLGNIYVNEVLFLSNIMPDRIAKTITNDELKKIINNSKIVLNEAILLNGSTIENFESAPGVIGKYQEKLKVHMRNGMKCYVCDMSIKKMKVNGRMSYFCSHCQK